MCCFKCSNILISKEKYQIFIREKISKTRWQIVFAIASKDRTMW